MNTDIHRLLDDAFAGVDMTPDARDLKEEVRANLMARAAELESAGTAPAAAARRAIEELGPIAHLLDDAPASGVRTANPATPSIAELHTRNKVRPKPGFVVRTTLLSLVAAGALTLATLAALDVIDGGASAVFVAGLAAAVTLGVITGDSLRQETTTNHALPTGRAVGYGAATFALVSALAAFGAFAVDTEAVALAIAGGALLLASIGLFSWLGATQTNRHKAWVRTDLRVLTRFETDEAAAARFGIYSGVIWIAGIGAAIGLAIAFAWWWALVVLGVCIVITMLILATMLFGSAKPNN